MAVLADLERLLERVFERSTARLFRAHPQAVQLERRVERAMERAGVTSGGRTAVPAQYWVRLQPDDLAGVSEATGGPEALAGRLADAALVFARAHGYHLSDRPSVILVSDPAVDRGSIEVAVGPGGPVRPPSAPISAPSAPVAPQAEASGAPAAPAAPVVSAAAAVPRAEASAGPPPLDSPPRAAPETPPALSESGIRGDGTSTLVFRRPAPAPTRAVIRVIAGRGVERTIEVDGTPITIGRAPDNGLVLADPRVSRRHARLQARRGTLVLTDLGSTNGSRVNGVRVDECALGTGDRVVLGDTVLVVEQLPG